MKRKVSSLILMLFLLITSVPFSSISAESTEEYSVYVGGIGLAKGDYLPVGATETQKHSPTNSGYAYYSGSQLILRNYSYTGAGYLHKESDKYTTKVYPTVIYSTQSLSLVLKGNNSLICRSEASHITRGIYVGEYIQITGDGYLYLKAERALYAEATITVKNVYLDIYSEYFYGIYSYRSHVFATNATLRIRGSRGIQTYSDNQSISFTNCHVDIGVTDIGIYSSGMIVVTDSYVKVISDNPDFPQDYCAIYSEAENITYANVSLKVSENPNGSNAGSFVTENVEKYRFVEFYRTKQLSYIDIADILPPEAVCAPDYDATADSPYTEILDIRWFELNEGKIVNTVYDYESFVKGKTYRLNVIVSATDGYEFNDTNTSAYIGNDLVNNYCKDLNLKIRVLEKDFVAKESYEHNRVKIGNIALKDGDYLPKGASSVTATKPNDNYAFYQNGTLFLVNFTDQNADIVFDEGLLRIIFTGENIVSSISDTYEEDENIHALTIDGEGSLDVIGYNDNLSRANGININGTLVIFNGKIYIDAYIYCCLDVYDVHILGGELYCYTSQAGVFASSTAIFVSDGSFHAFDGGGWWEFINEDVFIDLGDVFVSSDGKNDIETATEWDGVTSLSVYDAVWVLPPKEDSEPDEPEPTPDYLLGDVNNDGFVNSTDYLRIKGHFLGTLTLEGAEFTAGDVTKDGIINSTDYLRIKGHFLGTYELH